ncbi:hypothetical protein NB706_000568 [Xanthomonas sacchari]|nr:hypothetical protein [Xanthomonas sacchari]
MSPAAAAPFSPLMILSSAATLRVMVSSTGKCTSRIASRCPLLRWNTTVLKPM